MERGSVSLNVYGYYMRAVGIPLACIVAFGTISQTAMTVGTNFWLTAWSEAGLRVGIVHPAIFFFLNLHASVDVHVVGLYRGIWHYFPDCHDSWSKLLAYCMVRSWSKGRYSIPSNCFPCFACISRCPCSQLVSWHLALLPRLQ